MNERTRSMGYVVEGSVVRKLNEAPARRLRPEAEPPRKNKNENKRQSVPASLDRALAFNLKYTIFVVASVCIMIAACVVMLYMETRVSELKRNINSLEALVEEAQTDNAAYKSSIESMYTLDEIYDVAINELGMVYARSGQIIYYESADEDYVKQYRDVPEAN
ncbi:MAG: hypothetical protein NC393_02840 [Clostridium sp.]|nr:hypothetical protein [Clostridium sp.]MCM1208146.1 hypothetical protein [Ruminococcus sp.]